MQYDMVHLILESIGTLCIWNTKHASKWFGEAKDVPPLFYFRKAKVRFFIRGPHRCTLRILLSSIRLESVLVFEHVRPLVIFCHNMITKGFQKHWLFVLWMEFGLSSLFEKITRCKTEKISLRSPQEKIQLTS